MSTPAVPDEAAAKEPEGSDEFAREAEGLGLAAEAAQYLAQRTGIERYDLGIVLGSGWGGAAELIGETISTIPANEVPGFYAAAVPGHQGKLRSVRTPAGKDVLVIGARAHLYEGRGVRAVAHGVRTAAALGVKTMILSNGCAALHQEWPVGEPVLISDHLNLTAVSPLEGAHFVDLTDLYSPRIRQTARTIDPSLQEGVYAQFPGPHYETPAEIRYAQRIGADLLGMSTALEAIAARAVGMEVFGISLVTNLGVGLTPNPLSHDEILAAGQQAAPRISRLLADIVDQL